MKLTPYSERPQRDSVNRPGQRVGTAKPGIVRARRVETPRRKYEVAFLDFDGQVVEFTHLAPAVPAFEEAFGAIGHGAILGTANGPMAVEDLLPGDQIRMADGNFETLLWRGAITLNPQLDIDMAEASALIRITADALGPQRPSPDLILGPSARLYHTAAAVPAITGARAAFIPVRDFIDGFSFVELRPAAPVRVYQLGFAKHALIKVNGIGIETLHPGTPFSLGLRGETVRQLLDLFPHKSSFEDFGDLCYPRLRLQDLELYKPD